MNAMFENDEFLNMLLAQERGRRIKYEGPPEADTDIITDFTGKKFIINKNGRIWDRNNPCTICDDSECLKYLTELSKTIIPFTNEICCNPVNKELLKFLCAWRKHVKETFIIEQTVGSQKWKKYSICTSELTFLGRTTEQGGILGTISLTEKHICSLQTLVSLMEKEPDVHGGVKGLSIGFAMLIAMYMDWDLYTEENVKIVEKLLKKVRKDKKVGLETYFGTPWYIMFKCVMERRRIPDKLKEIILSRAHLP